MIEVSSDKILTALNKDRIIGGSDPIFRFLYRITLGKVWITYICALLFYMVLTVLIGLFFTHWYLNSKFISLLDPRELPYELFFYSIIAPLIWTFFSWQPNGFYSMLAKLSENKIFTNPKGTVLSLDKLFIDFNNSVPKKKGFFILPTLFTVAGIAIWLLALNSPNNPYTYGNLQVWWQVNPYYFWLIWLPLIYVNLYMGVWMIIRQVFFTAFLNSIFSKYHISPKPFHPDKCNGLSVVGDYVIRIAFTIILLGFWVSAVITVPMFFGQSINLHIDTILLSAIYIIAIPVSIIAPVWSTHQAMLNAKHKRLGLIAVEIQSILDDTKNPQKTVETREYLDELQKRYKILDVELHTWPFRAIAIRAFSASAITPILSTIIPIVIQQFLSKP